MNPLMLEILKKGFTLELTSNKEGTEIMYKLDGFYKSSGIELYDKGDYLLAIDRYKSETEIHEFSDLVSLNLSWWISSKNRFDGWNTPDNKWVPYLIEYGFIKEDVETVKTYTIK